MNSQPHWICVERLTNLFCFIHSFIGASFAYFCVVSAICALVVVWSMGMVHYYIDGIVVAVLVVDVMSLLFMFLPCRFHSASYPSCRRLMLLPMLLPLLFGRNETNIGYCVEQTDAFNVVHLERATHSIFRIFLCQPMRACVSHLLFLIIMKKTMENMMMLHTAQARTIHRNYTWSMIKGRERNNCWLLLFSLQSMTTLRM